jgi:hypothetical protein
LTRIRAQRPAADVLAEIEATLDAVTTPPPDWSGSGVQARRDDDPMWQMGDTAARWDPDVGWNPRLGEVAAESLDDLMIGDFDPGTMRVSVARRLQRAASQTVRYEACNPSDPARRHWLRDGQRDGVDIGRVWLDEAAGFPDHPRLFREADTVRMLETHQLTAPMPIVVIGRDRRDIERWCDEGNIPDHLRRRQIIGITGVPDLRGLMGSIPQAAVVLDSFDGHPHRVEILAEVVTRLTAADQAEAAHRQAGWPVPPHLDNPITRIFNEHIEEHRRR